MQKCRCPDYRFYSAAHTRQTTSPYDVTHTGQPQAPPLYLAWGGEVSAAAGVLDVPRALAASLGLSAGCTLQLTAKPQVPEAEQVVVEPLGPSDWEVVELNAGLLEEQVLMQVGQGGGGGGGQGLSEWV